MQKVAIINPVRTGIGSFNGQLSTLCAVDLGAITIEKSLNGINLKEHCIDEVYMGNVLQAGSGQNPARQSAIKAGIPISVPAVTINSVCGSGLHAVGLAYNSILSGQSGFVVAGGMESMSNAPYILKKARNGYRLGNGEIIDSLTNDGLTCPFNNYHMGITAENVAEKYNITRREQDEFAYASQMKAAKAKNENVFADEIIPVTIKNKKGSIIFKEDEFIRPDTTVEKLAKLGSAFKADGAVTAGNSSGINDCAAVMLIVSENMLKELNVKPLVYIKGFTLVGVEPAYMGLGPIKAVSGLLKKLFLNINQIDLFELNEAFAAQSIAVCKELGVDTEKVNVNGGAIALGHPIGASGARILVTLIHQMVKTGKRFGLASLCIGAGMGIALIVENPNI